MYSCHICIAEIEFIGILQGEVDSLKSLLSRIGSNLSKNFVIQPTIYLEHPD